MGINLKIMSKRKGSVYKKKKGLVKDLTRNILQEFNRDPKKILNYKQIASKLEVNDPNGRNQIIQREILPG